jgi:hypothetical protein
LKRLTLLHLFLIVGLLGLLAQVASAAGWF